MNLLCTKKTKNIILSTGVRRPGEFEKLTAPTNEKNNFSTVNISLGMGKKLKLDPSLA